MKKDDKEFVYRFKLDGKTARPLIDDPPAEMVRKQLEALLKIVVLSEEGRELKPDRFRFMSNPLKDFPIFDDTDSDT